MCFVHVQSVIIIWNVHKFTLGDTETKAVYLQAQLIEETNFCSLARQIRVNTGDVQLVKF